MKREEAIVKALDESEKRKLAESLYKPLDEYLKRLKRRIKELFAPLYVSGFDELNIIRLNRTTAEMYTELDDFNRENYLKLVEHSRAWAEKILGKKLSSADLKYLVNSYLKGYDPTTQYVYIKEVDRKRMRLNEAILTANEYQDVGKLQKSVKKAADLWYTQSSQYGLALMMLSIHQAYEEEGVTLVRWITQEDEKVCPECFEKDGQIFDEDVARPPLHYNCRCIVIPENPENPV